MPIMISQPSAAPAGPGNGDVNGPASSTDNAVVVYDGTTGKVVKDSTLTVNALGLTFPAGSQLFADAGTDAAPGIAFAGDPGTGLYQETNGDGDIDFASAGVHAATLNAAGLTLAGTMSLDYVGDPTEAVAWTLPTSAVNPLVISYAPDNSYGATTALLTLNAITNTEMDEKLQGLAINLSATGTAAYQTGVYVDINDGGFGSLSAFSSGLWVYNNHATARLGYGVLLYGSIDVGFAAQDSRIDTALHIGPNKIKWTDGSNWAIAATEMSLIFDGGSGVDNADTQHTHSDFAELTVVGDIVADGQTVSRRSTDLTEIFEMADFPAAVAGVITLTTGKYSIRSSLVTSDRFEIGAGQIVTFEFENRRSTTITYTGTATLFTITNATQFDLNNTSFVLSGVGAQFMDVSGPGNCIIEAIQIVFANTGQSIGTVADAAQFLLTTATAYGFEDGITLEDVNAFQLTSMFLQSNGVGTLPIVTVACGIGLAGTVSDAVMVPGVSQAVLHVCPCVRADIRVTGVSKLGGDGFFKVADKNGTIASMTDQSVVAQAITAVADNGSGKARFTSTTHGLSVGERVDHTTFAVETSYNGTWLKVTAVSDADHYDIDAITYTATDTGQVDADTVEITDVAHGLLNDEAVRIHDTFDYDVEGYDVFNKTNDTFEISATWVSSQTGTWDNASIDQHSKYVYTQNNGDQADSHSSGEVLVGGNATPTTITLTTTFYDLNLGGSALESGSTARFTLIDSTTGEIRYDGLNPQLVEVSGLVAAISSGGAQRFNFRLLLNGSPLAAPDNVDVPIEIGAAVTSAPLHWDLHLDPGDLLRLQVENADGTSNITIDTLKFSVRA